MRKTARENAAPDRLSTYFRQEVGPLSIVTVTGLLYNVGLTAGPFFEGQLAQKLYDIMSGRAVFAEMVRLALLYFAVILAVQAARCLKRFYVRRFANDTARSMRRVLYRHLVRQSRADLAQESVGTLMTKAISDVDACAEGMRKFTTEVFDTGIALAAYLVMLFCYDWRLALLASCFTPPAYLLAEKLKVVVYRYTTRYKKAAGALNDATMERVRGAETYRVFGREADRDAAFEKTLTNYEHAAVLANIWETTLQPIYSVISMLGVLFILYFGDKNVLGTGWCRWDIAAFTAFLSCFAKMAIKSSKAAKLFNAVQKARVSWQRIKPLMAEAAADAPDAPAGEGRGDNTPAAEPGEDRAAAPATHKTAAAPEPPVPLELRVQNLAAGFVPGEPVFAGLTFTAAPGDFIGVTGPVACGKTTLGRVFLGELPYTGSITLNGTELRSLPDAVRNRLVGYLGHNPELMADTLAENIRYGDKKDIAPALDAVCFGPDLATMPEGAETEIGSSGARLSGGQQDRIALARTLCHARPLLVLDDPFSAVDTATEGQILTQLRTLCPDSIFVILTHRITRFPDFAKIIWMQNGRCTVGNHAELVATVPDYAGIYAAQQGGGDLDA